MNKKYIYQNKKELKKAFFDFCKNMDIETKGKKTKFDITLNIAFKEWKEGLKGQISRRLYNCKLY